MVGVVAVGKLIKRTAEVVKHSGVFDHRNLGIIGIIGGPGNITLIPGGNCIGAKPLSFIIYRIHFHVRVIVRRKIIK